MILNIIDKFNVNINIIHEFNNEKIIQISYKWKCKIQSNFLYFPQDELIHLFKKWIINKIVMNEYISNYVK